MKHVFLLMIILTSYVATAQHSTCDGTRYTDNVFTDFTLTEAVQYGQNTTIGGNDRELFLDVYEPAGDTEERRPVIVLAFGGSFIAGERADLAPLCESYARKGFVAVTIDYRIFDGPLFPFPDAAVLQDVVVRAIGDMRASVRFLKEDAANENLFRIDPDFIMVGGVSAGAITALHAAVLDETDPIPETLLASIEANGGFEGNSSDNFEFDSDVIGIINFSGALNNVTLYDDNDPPVFSVHDDGDTVVPFGDGFATIMGFPIAPLEGSAEIHRFVDSLGIQNALVTIENSNGHVSYFGDPATTVDILDQSSVFMESLICGTILSTENLQLANTTIFPNPATDRINIESETPVGYVSLYNMTGQLVNNWTQETILDIADVQGGQYMLQIRDNQNEIISVNKILIVD